jgi:hypothetical protein
LGMENDCAACDLELLLSKSFGSIDRRLER